MRKRLKPKLTKWANKDAQMRWRRPPSKKTTPYTERRRTTTFAILATAERSIQRLTLKRIVPMELHEIKRRERDAQARSDRISIE